ncbi:MAG: hypothetical protein ACRENA_15835 [Vulcanimicrobiaceae bacterium]
MNGSGLGGFLLASISLLAIAKPATAAPNLVVQILGYSGKAVIVADVTYSEIKKDFQQTVTAPGRTTLDLKYRPVIAVDLTVTLGKCRVVRRLHTPMPSYVEVDFMKDCK